MAKVQFPLRLEPNVAQAINREAAKRRMHPVDLVRLFIEQGLAACFAGKPLGATGGPIVPEAVAAEALEALFFCKEAMKLFVPEDRRGMDIPKLYTAAKQQAGTVLGRQMPDPAATQTG